MNEPLHDDAPASAPAPVPTGATTAQAPAAAARLFWDMSRGRFVFERGPERLDVLVMPSLHPRIEGPNPEAMAR